MPYIGNQPGTGVRSRFIYTATASQTTFSGADNNSKTLKYADSAYVDVFLNGVCLVPGTDYTASTKTSIVLTQAASLNDTLEVVAYDIATLSDTVSKADGGTFEDGVTIRTADNTTQLTLESTDADASVGPVLDLHRNSSSPADADTIGEIAFKGQNDADETLSYGFIKGFISDASDGTEDGQLNVNTIVGGTTRQRIKMDSTATVFNEEGRDLDFRVESDGNTHALFLQGSDGFCGIGTDSPATKLDVDGGANSDHATFSGTAARGLKISTASGGAADEFVVLDAQASGTTQGFAFKTGGTEGMRLDDNNFYVGTTNGNPTGNHEPGMLVSKTGQINIHRDSGNPLRVGRSDDGNLTEYYKQGSLIGYIGTGNSGDLYIGNSGTGFMFAGGSLAIIPTNQTSLVDNAIALGLASYRYDDAFITNGVTTGSDQNEKQQIASLTSAEITAAKAISALFKTFKWNDAVASKGDAARTHTGVIAQEIETAMSNAGLDASKYAFWCSDTWWTKDVEVAAVEADEEKGIEAQDAYTRTDHYDTKDEAPEGATEHTRLGVRYPELLAFVGAATEQRLTSIESRLTALEGE